MIRVIKSIVLVLGILFIALSAKDFSIAPVRAGLIGVLFIAIYHKIKDEQ